MEFQKEKKPYNIIKENSKWFEILEEVIIEQNIITIKIENTICLSLIWFIKEIKKSLIVVEL